MSFHLGLSQLLSQRGRIGDNKAEDNLPKRVFWRFHRPFPILFPAARCCASALRGFQRLGICSLLRCMHKLSPAFIHQIVKFNSTTWERSDSACLFLQPPLSLQAPKYLLSVARCCVPFLYPLLFYLHFHLLYFLPISRLFLALPCLTSHSFFLLHLYSAETELLIFTF